MYLICLCMQMTIPYLNFNISQDIGEEVINAELSKLWELGANKLSLNIAKTKYMVFHNQEICDISQFKS